MLKELIKLANELDRKGLPKEADKLDAIIKSAEIDEYDDDFWEYSDSKTDKQDELAIELRNEISGLAIDIIDLKSRMKATDDTDEELSIAKELASLLEDKLEKAKKLDKLEGKLESLRKSKLTPKQRASRMNNEDWHDAYNEYLNANSEPDRSDW